MNSAGLYAAAPLLAWRILCHEKGRAVLATGGVFIAILLVFIELGFFIALTSGQQRWIKTLGIGHNEVFPGQER